MTTTTSPSTRLLQKAPTSESSTWLARSTAGYVRSGRSANPLSITISYVCSDVLLNLFSSSPSEQDRLELARLIQEHMDFTYEGGLVKYAGACESAAVGATMLLVRYAINNPSTRFPVDHLFSYFQPAFFIAGRKLDRKNEVGWWRLFGNPIHNMAAPALRKGLREHTSIDRETCEIIMEDVWAMLAHPAWINQLTTAFPSRQFDSPSISPPTSPSKSSLFSRITHSRPSTHWTAIVHAQCKTA